MAIVIGENPRGRSTRALAELALVRLKELYIDLDFPRRFEEKELPTGELPAMARLAGGNFFVQNNVRKASQQDLQGIYEASLRGWWI